MNRQIRKKRQQKAQMTNTQVQFSENELMELENIACTKCGGTLRINGTQLKKVPMTHPKNHSGQEATAILPVSECLVCLIKNALQQAAADAAKDISGKGLIQ